MLFLSAHLDDAVLSCGALVMKLAEYCPVTVATLFTAAGAPPHTYAARSFLRQCAAPDAATLFADRRAEDRDVLARLGVGYVHMGAADALFRTRDFRSAMTRRLGGLVPELKHRYPTYRFDIARGRVSRGDLRLIVDLSSRVADLMGEIDAPLIFCPVGVGNHVDHLITRTIGGLHSDRVIYYSDFPYNQSSGPNEAFIRRHRLVSWTWEQQIVAKHELIRGYRTQADALFPGGQIAERPEIYYETAAASD